MGRRHLAACRAAARVEPVAVVEPVDAVRAALAEGGLRAYRELDELLSADGVDAVLIAAPSDRHRELAVAVLAAGLPLLCEKPCGLSADEARAVAAAAEAGGVPLQIGYWRRFVPEIAQLRERIAAGELGRVALVGSHQWDEHPPSPEFRAHSGGIAVDMGVHELDLIPWLTGGAIEHVVALAGEPADDPDTAVITLALAGGALGVATLGRRFHLPDSCWVEAVGERDYARHEFMWGAAGDAVFERALAAQADAFAELADGGPRRGAGGLDAVAALDAAGRVTAALAGPVVEPA
jgi:myo-inositol 2-dehydrogenase / D-chiro-inositol 1-dehydrogenase